MISKLSVTNDTVTPVSWWHKVFTKAMDWEFKPGVNIVWGPNGSGKSTLLTLLARLHFCEHLGYSKVTEKEFYDTVTAYQDTLPKGIEVLHDGQEVRYFSPEKVVGQAYGTGGFDWEADDALEPFMLRGSTGQLNMHRLGKVATRKLVSPVAWKSGLRMSAPLKGETPSKRYNVSEWINNYLTTAKIEKDRPTVLLDEPDAGMDWPNKAAIWDLIVRSSKYEMTQWIVASHSVYAMFCENANYIEMEPGYLERCRADVLKIMPSQSR